MTAAAGAAPIPLSAAQPCTQKKDRAFVSARKKLALSLSYPVAKESGKKFGATYIICWAPKRKKEGGAASIGKRESRIV